MRCYACERQDVSQCPRCGKNYCPDHGADLCSACLDPVIAAPSSAAFRIALFALLGASVLALWLLVRPPGVPGDNGVVQQPDGTPLFTPALTPDTGETPTPTGAAEPTLIPGDQTPAPTPVPTASPTPTPVPTPAPIEYIVESGDSWNIIAADFGVDPVELAESNGYSITDVLPLGITLIIPQ